VRAFICHKAALDETSHEFLPSGCSTCFCGTAPRAEEFLYRMTQLLPQLLCAILLHKWRTRLSLTINREIANAIFEGAMNARGGERQFAAGRGLAESNLHLFEPVQLLL